MGDVLGIIQRAEEAIDQDDAKRLEGKIKVDHDTARRLFTLICALHWKG